MKNISKFTLGTVQLGMEYGVANVTGKPTTEKSHEIIKTALELGVTSLDTAAAYGSSEAIIGSFIEKHGDIPFITSKFRLKGEDIRCELKESLENTLLNLRRDHIDVYMFHAVGDMLAYSDGLQKTFTKESRIRAPGASIYNRSEAEAVLAKPYLRAIQLPAGVLDTRLITSGIISDLAKSGVMVFVRSVFLQGLVCMETLPEEFSLLKGSIDELKEVARAEDMTMPQLAVSYIRDVEGVTSLALGCETVEQVRENARLIACPPLSEAARDCVTEISKRVPIEETMKIITSRK